MGWMTNQDRWTFWDKLVFWLVFIPVGLVMAALRNIWEFVFGHAKDCQCVECYEQPRKE